MVQEVFSNNVPSFKKEKKKEQETELWRQKTASSLLPLDTHLI